VLKFSSNVSDVFPKVLKLSSEVSECKPLIDGTVFAYGVTSSGKTHTMRGTHARPAGAHTRPHFSSP
jgi:hypothetical protein